MDHHTTLSRTASRASHRSRNSNLSRTQSLVKKNIELIDLKPADVLIERFVAWKVIVNQLTSYFEGVAEIETNIARDLTKLAGVIQVPFRAGNQFLGEGGLQDVYYNIRDKTRIIADQHADLGRTVHSSIVQHLQKLRAEIKAHIKNVQNDTGKLAASVAKERELSTKLVGELANNISTFKNTPMHLLPKNDPYISNQAVARQLQRQVLEENLLQKSIVMMQQNSAHFEEGIVRSIQSAWQTFDEWQSRAASASQEVLRSLNTHMLSLAPDREWIQFAARSDHLLDPDTPLRDPSAIKYPLKDDPVVVPVHVGHLERKKRFTRTYTESYFALTPAGFLHEFPSSDPAVSLSPTFSLFLPACTLGPPSAPTSRAHKFHIEGRKDGTGATNTKTGSLRGLIPLVNHNDSTKAWSFRARSRDEMMEWWNDIRMLCARYLIASEMVDRTGPVEAAVKAAGYNSEDFEADEDDEVDGEDDDAGAQRGDEIEVDRHEGEVGHRVSQSENVPPRYSQAHTLSDKPYDIKSRPNGYAIDNKRHSGHYPPDLEHHTRDNDNIDRYPEIRRRGFYASPGISRNADGVLGKRIQPLVSEPTGGTLTVDPGPVFEDEDVPSSRKSNHDLATNRTTRRRNGKALEVNSAEGEPREEPRDEADTSAIPNADDITHQIAKSRTISPLRRPRQHQQIDLSTSRTSPPSTQPQGREEHRSRKDSGEAADDIYGSEHEDSDGVHEEEVAKKAGDSRSGLIGSVAASIGNVVRGATGRV